jgi:hypothetical protein
VLDLTNVPSLGNLAGQPNAWIALVFQSDVDTNYPEGAYVDDIVLRKCSVGCTGSPASLVPSDTHIQENSIDKLRRAK